MDKKDIYRYWAVFHHADDGISVNFPDFPGCLTCGDTEDEAYRMASEALELHLYGMERDHDIIPDPSLLKTLMTELKSNEAIVEIKANMLTARGAIANYAIKKNLTIPQWLNEEALKYDLNFSQVLQEALKERLGIYKDQ